MVLDISSKICSRAYAKIEDLWTWHCTGAGHMHSFFCYGTYTYKIKLFGELITTKWTILTLFFFSDIPSPWSSVTAQFFFFSIVTLPVFIFDFLFYIYLLYRRTTVFLLTSVGDRASVDKIVLLVLFPVPVDL